jgi:hypothetical protein
VANKKGTEWGDPMNLVIIGDPYFTDGLRIVLWVSSTPVSLQNVEVFDWEIPIHK